jgi:uncharacterized integral membrane protein
MIVARPSTTITAAAMYPRIGWGIGRPPRRARSTLCQRRRASRCHHAGQDERDPDQLPRPEDAPGWKDPFGGHAGDHQGQPSAKPRQIGPLIGEFGLGIGPAPSRTTAILPLRPCPRDSSYQGATDLPLLEGQYLPSYLTLRGRDFSCRKQPFWGLTLLWDGVGSYPRAQRCIEEDVMTVQPGGQQPGGQQPDGRNLSGGAIASLTGVGVLLIFIFQNTDRVRFQFLFWTFTWPLWWYTIMTALFGALVWFGLGVMRRHRRRVERRAAR